MRLVEERLADPLRWRRPRRVFVNSMSDLFHEALTDEQITAVFGVMGAASQHTFQVLTKRALRMRDFMTTENGHDNICETTCAYLDASGFERGCGSAFDLEEWPPRNVWLGVSVEDDERAALRIPHILKTPAATRFLSCEPLLGPIDLRSYLARGIGWVIVGAESGRGARPMEEEWARDIKDQCVEAGVPFFFKQDATPAGRKIHLPVLDGRQWTEFPR